MTESKPNVSAGGTEITRFNALRHGVLSRYTVLHWQHARETGTGHAGVAPLPTAPDRSLVDPQVGDETRRAGCRYFLQRMKTELGACNHPARKIHLKTELTKKPEDLLEYGVVHEMVHLIEPNHNERFVALMTKHYPTWCEARAELNELPLAAEVWRE